MAQFSDDETWGLLDALASRRPLRDPQDTGASMRNVRALLSCVDDPHLNLPTVHVAGSRGKGSTALMIEAILLAAGLRVGTFTSPHLIHWRERFRLQGNDVSARALHATLEAIWPAVQRLDASIGFFEVATAAALLLFRRAGVEFAIMEAGIGGRDDATNVVSPQVSCITGIELEHTELLGATLRDIARAKAGIIRAGIPLVLGRLPPPARAVVRAEAARLGSTCLELDHDFNLQTQRLPGARIRFVYHSPRLDLEAELPVAGAHLAANAALAVACVEALGGLTASELQHAASTGLAAVRLPGRTEILRRAPLVIADAAHTRDAAAALRALLDELADRPLHLLISASSRQAATAVATHVVGCAERVTLTRADAVRSLDLGTLASTLGHRHNVTTCTDPVSAAQQALADTPKGGILCVTGSVYIAGVVQRLLRATP